ncbi:hypothetical protein SAMN05444422_11475 [Halobiforma haloterrestris]|uniref:Uncharacterized protein n=1 Tax=Natronobacterium haloterrestre TaxID=148448 RepID=A0A1I1L4Y0_NATHA|nr:hypothetical protein [Halobiforma haloterrestris]SFC68106.1 hypothetical protein SAMN05444422_11475 [Halobiforma haloterrestris]
MPHDNTRASATSWHSAKRRARDQKYNTKVEVPKAFVAGVPPEFERSLLSLPNGAKAVYRDQEPTDSFQIREFDDHYTIEMDRHNPETGNAVAHAVQDAPAYTAVGLAVLGGAALFS